MHGCSTMEDASVPVSKCARQGGERACCGDILLREAHHRMANVLALIQALLRRELAALENEEVRAAVGRLDERLLALGDLHRILASGSRSSRIEVADHFGRLCRALADAVLEPAGISCIAFIQDGPLPTNVCEKLSIIVSELVINAAKHAFRKNPSRVVRIELAVQAGSWSCIVSDNGIGISSSRRGHGSELIDSLVDAMGAHISRHSGAAGTTVTVASATL